MSGFDITGLEETIAELEGHAKEPRQFISGSKRRLQHAIDRERENHAYQNRSHNAETNTLLLVFGEGGDAEFTVEMNVEYASYLQDMNGKKWSRFDELVKAAFGDIDIAAAKL